MVSVVRVAGVPLRILPLGGLGEIGMNCLALEQGGEALVVDCGVTFDDRGLGIDVVHPDFAALEGLHVAGIFVTHGHEDHIGAIPYLLRRFDVPVFGPRYALGLVRERAAEHEILGHVRAARGDAALARAGGPVRGRAHPRDPLDRRRDGARHPDATRGSSCTRATSSSTRRRRTARRSTSSASRSSRREGVRLLLSDSTNIDARGADGQRGGRGRRRSRRSSRERSRRSSWACSRRTCTGCGCWATSRAGTGASSCRSGAA